MAKKQKFELDEYGFESELDMPDFNFNFGEVKDDRTPATKIKDGAIQGAKQTAMSPQFIRRVIKQALPKGYGQAMEAADASAASLKNLYNTSAQEIKPVYNELKRTTARAMPSIEKALPRRVADRIKKWAKPEEEWRGMSAEQSRESGLSMQLADIFKYQAETGAQEKAENDVKDKLREGIDQSRHRDTLGQLDAIRISLQQLANYQHKVGANYQRKSLELQYRHYFVAQDMLVEQKRSAAKMEEHLEYIVKNTGLPDYLKLKGTERFGEAMRNRFIDSLQDGVFARRDNFVKGIGERFQRIVGDRVRSFTDSARMGFSMANQVMDTGESMKDMGGPGMHEMGANLAAGYATNSAGEWMGRKAGKYVSKIPGVNRVGNKLEYGFDNFPQLAGEYMNSPTSNQGRDLPQGLTKVFPQLEGKKAKIPGFVWNFARDLVNSGLTGPDTQLNIDQTTNLGEGISYNRHAHKSITEVIPGFLARIHQEINMLRTGSDSADLLTYDFTTNKFTSTTEARHNAFNRVVKKFDKEMTRTELDQLIDQLDPQGKLDTEQRSILAKQLLRDNMNNKIGSVSRLGDASRYEGTSKQHAEVYAELFKNYFANDADHSKRNAFSGKFNKLGTSITDSRRDIQDLSNLGMGDFLRDAGIVNEAGQIDLEKLYDYYVDSEYNPSSTAQRGNGKRMRRAARPVRPTTAKLTAGVEDRRSQHAGTGNEANGELLAAIRETNVRTIAETMSDTLKRIEDRLAEGLVTFTAESPQVIENQGKAPKGRWWNRSLKDSAKGMMGFGWEKFQQARQIGSNAFDRFLGVAGTGLRTAKDVGMDLGGRALNRIRGFRDVYVKGEKLPRLTAWKLKAGHYRDEATGKIIKSFKDISGNVVDDEGNLVMSAEEVKAAFVKSGLVQKTLDTMGVAVDMVKGVGQDFMRAIPVAYQMGLKIAGGVWNSVLNAPQDVYVRGKADPVLLGRIMKAGGYFSRATGKAIKHPGQIDGVILNEDGDVVLSEEDMKGGLLTKDGKPLRTGLGKLTGMVTDAIGTGIGLARKGIQWAGNKFNQVMGGLGSFVGKIFGEHGLVFAGSKTMLERLTEIRDILDTRMPKRKTIADDLDGDGDRDGSWQDIMAKRKQQASTKKEAKEKERLATTSGSLTGLGLTNLLAKLRKKDEDEEEEDDGSLLDDAADLADVADWANGDGDDGDRKKGKRGRKAKGPKRGMWSRIKGAGSSAKNAGSRMLGSGGKMLGAAKASGALGLGAKVLGGAGAVYGGISAYDNLSKGNYGAAAVDTGLALGGLALNGSLLGALGTAGAAIGAIIGSPVVIGAAAIAGLGLAGYYGYKWLKTKKMSMLTKMRYVQYGFTPEDGAHIEPVFGFEGELSKGLVFNGGQPDLDPKKVDMKKLLSFFDIDPTDEADAEKLHSWSLWFTNRFKPIFMNHVAALNAVMPGKPLAAIDDLKADEKKRYFDVAKFPGGPYNFLVNPFDPKGRLGANSEMVELAISTAEKMIAQEAGNEKKPTQGQAGLVGAAGVAAVNASNQGVPSGTASASNGTSLGLATAVAGGATLGAGGRQTTIDASFGGYKTSASGRLDALTSIRFKTYGLTELVQEKVRALEMLEQEVQKNVQLNGKSTASWTGDIDRVLTAVGPLFGVTGIENNHAYEWKTWFNGRFMPTYLNYVTAVVGATGRQEVAMAINALKPEQAVDVAMAISGSQATAVFGGSVWSVTASPWPGYVLNTSVSSIEPNVQGLKEVAKRNVLQETVGKKEGTGLGADNGAGITNGTIKGGMLTQAWDRAKNVANNLWEGAKGMVSGAKDAIFGGDQRSGTHTPSSSSGGTVVGEMGKGAGGLMSALPMPTGPQGKFASVKDLISQAAKMVGVDEKMMQTMAAIESGFKWAVKAPTSSATGLYQFITSTWNEMIGKYGSKYGITPGTSPTDPRANALLGGEFLKENANGLKNVLKRPITDTDLYIAHFMGLSDAKKLLTADPGAVAATLFPKPAAANKNIFYTPDGRPRTVGEVIQYLNALVKNRGKQFGLGVDGPGSEAIVAKESASTASAASSSAAVGTDVAVAGPKALGSIPVSDQTPAVSTASKPVAATPAAPVPMAPTVDPMAGMSNGGFVAPAPSSRSRDLNAQNQFQRDSMAAVLGTMDETSRESLGVQREQLLALQALVKLVGSGSKLAASEAGAPTTQTASAPRTTQQMAKAPVSMAKAN